MHNPRTSRIKREQRKSFLLRQLSEMLYTLGADEPMFNSLFITRIDLSDDGGICYVYCSATPLNQEEKPEELFRKIMPQLIFYKPSMRKALADTLQKRYTPDIKFIFDDKKEKVDHINMLLDRVQQELDVPEQHDVEQDSTEES